MFKLPAHLAFLAATVLTACGGSQQGAMPTSPGSNALQGAFADNAAGVNGYQLLYSFTKASGLKPDAGLINVNGILYGTTAYGGPLKYGNIFSVTTAGVEQTIYTFTGGTDGGRPLAAMIDVNGTLYGTTEVNTIFRSEEHTS